LTTTREVEGRVETSVGIPHLNGRAVEFVIDRSDVIVFVVKQGRKGGVGLV
jgi:hypothetical protein